LEAVRFASGPDFAFTVGFASLVRARPALPVRPAARPLPPWSGLAVRALLTSGAPAP
jgi:hypothetical protein